MYLLNTTSTSKSSFFHYVSFYRLQLGKFLLHTHQSFVQDERPFTYLFAVMGGRGLTSGEVEGQQYAVGEHLTHYLIRIVVRLNAVKNLLYSATTLNGRIPNLGRYATTKFAGERHPNATFRNAKHLHQLLACFLVHFDNFFHSFCFVGRVVEVARPLLYLITFALLCSVMAHHFQDILEVVE